MARFPEYASKDYIKTLRVDGIVHSAAFNEYRYRDVLNYIKSSGFMVQTICDREFWCNEASRKRAKAEGHHFYKNLKNEPVVDSWKARKVTCLQCLAAEPGVINEGNT